MTENGAQFVAKLFKTKRHEVGTRMGTMTAYNHQINGQAEGYKETNADFVTACRNTSTTAIDFSNHYPSGITTDRTARQVQPRLTSQSPILHRHELWIKFQQANHVPTILISSN